MSSCCGKRRHVRHQGRRWERRQVSHRIGVILGLFALLALLVSHVVHTVEISSKGAHPPGFGPSLHLHSPGTTPARFITVAGPQRTFHDPFFCPVCQILAQTRHALVSTGTSFSLLHSTVVSVLCWTLRHAGPDLAAAPPRAPPSLT
jgi:hypothetical protein